MNLIKKVQIALWSLVAMAGVGAALLSMGMVPRQGQRVQSWALPISAGRFS